MLVPRRGHQADRIPVNPSGRTPKQKRNPRPTVNHLSAKNLSKVGRMRGGLEGGGGIFQGQRSHTTRNYAGAGGGGETQNRTSSNKALTLCPANGADYSNIRIYVGSREKCTPLINEVMYLRWFHSLLAALGNKFFAHYPGSCTSPKPTQWSLTCAGP